jgi:hypothetical protein
VVLAAVAIIMNFDLFVFSVAPSPTALSSPCLDVCAVPGRRIDPTVRERDLAAHEPTPTSPPPTPVYVS